MRGCSRGKVILCAVCKGGLSSQKDFYVGNIRPVVVGWGERFCGISFIGGNIGKKGVGAVTGQITTSLYAVVVSFGFTSFTCTSPTARTEARYGIRYRLTRAAVDRTGVFVVSEWNRG